MAGECEVKEASPYKGAKRIGRALGEDTFTSHSPDMTSGSSSTVLQEATNNAEVA